MPEYEKLYEPKSEGFSFENAARIEERAWMVTEKLVAAFDEEQDEIEEQENVSAVTGAMEEQHEAHSEEGNGSDDSRSELIDGLKLLLSGDRVGFDRYALGIGTLPDALADEMNAMLLEKIGDIAVERDGDGYRIAEWYTEEVEEIVLNNGRG